VLPLEHTIYPQQHAKLAAEGGYDFHHSNGFQVEGVLSYGAARSHTAGNEGVKDGAGWETLSTTVIEDLNVLEILTADRIVGQIILSHPAEGYVPEISFLGTRFENLRIGGYPVDLAVDLNILGEKPAKDGAYSQDEGVLERVSGQYEKILKSKKLPDALGEHYNRLSSKLKGSEEFKCSLVTKAGGLFPGTSHGNVIVIPNFGTITLAEVTVTHSGFDKKTGKYKKTKVDLKMLDLHLGCPIHGNLGIGNGTGNGTSDP
jgi:hypothetical protein